MMKRSGVLVLSRILCESCILVLESGSFWERTADRLKISLLIPGVALPRPLLRCVSDNTARNQEAFRSVVGKKDLRLVTSRQELKKFRSVGRNKRWQS